MENTKPLAGLIVLTVGGFCFGMLTPLFFIATSALPTTDYWRILPDGCGLTRVVLSLQCCAQVALAAVKVECSKQVCAAFLHLPVPHALDIVSIPHGELPCSGASLKGFACERAGSREPCFTWRAGWLLLQSTTPTSTWPSPLASLLGA